MSECVSAYIFGVGALRELQVHNTNKEESLQEHTKRKFVLLYVKAITIGLNIFMYMCVKIWQEGDESKLLRVHCIAYRLENYQPLPLFQCCMPYYIASF